MPALYALLAGINAYPNPNQVLKGCLNDLKHLHAYLEAYCSTMGYTYRPLLLRDADATRQAIIDGFGHFQAAEKEDLCLFHFSGHGSRCPAPEAFWDSEPDRQLESIVCWDSRLPGGHDLMDKELSYLVWQASLKTELPFITIMDCCHSGDMRGTTEKKHDLQLEVVGVRALREAGNGLSGEQFLGIEHYKKTGGGQLSPPLGRRVHLGAARNTEYAKEVIAGGQSRGVFTYCLIEALEATGSLVLYTELLSKVNLRINNVVKEQSAQLGATFTEDRNLGFLFSRTSADRPSRLVAWDKALGSWIVNAGALHGICHDTRYPATIELLDDGHIITVESVLPNRSKVSGMDGYDNRRSYMAAVKHWAIPRLELAFAAGCDPEGVSLLSGQIQLKAADQLHLRDHIEGKGYLVHARNGEYFLSRTHDDSPLFQREKGFNEAAAAAFVRKLSKVADWQQTLELYNPDTLIRPTEIETDLYRITEPGNDTDDAPVEKTDWQAGAVVYRYADPNLKPAFQLKLRNTGRRALWVGMLYLGSDFSMTNQLLPKVMLAPGEECYAQEIYKGFAYRTIPLRIEADQLSQGISTVDEYIKILISTEELHTDFYFREGLATDTGSTRLAGRKEELQGQDWATKTIWIRVEYSQNI